MIVFVSTYLSHHQLPFCLQMVELTKQNFCYIACEPIRDTRLQLGYEDLNNAYPFVIRAYESEAQQQAAIRLCDTCDVLLVGSAPETYYKKRICEKKLTLRICERPFKEPFTLGNFFRRSVGMLRHFIPYQNKNYYLFAASAYTANDFLRYGCFRNRMYQWGYFPDLHIYPDGETLMAQKKENAVLWVGRMIEWKHPETALRLASRLKEEGIDFCLTMIGNGELLDSLREQVKALNLTDCVELLGSMPTETVRQKMEQSKILLFTSDRREGWGAVVNEGMNAGCAVVANRAAGSVPFLIEDGINGFTYCDKDIDNAFQKLKLLLTQPSTCRNLGLTAYDSIIESYSAETAARRLMDVLAHLQATPSTPYFYNSGICSAAVKQKP